MAIEPKPQAISGSLTRGTFLKKLASSGRSALAVAFTFQAAFFSPKFISTSVD